MKKFKNLMKKLKNFMIGLGLVLLPVVALAGAGPVKEELSRTGVSVRELKAIATPFSHPWPRCRAAP